MNKIAVGEHPESIGGMLRYWRNHQRVSQLELALDIGISAKHLSFVETGRSQPSRELILRIARRLNLSYRHQNILLHSAGYSPEFREEPLNSEEMTLVRETLRRMLAQQEPYPAIVIDSSYNILMQNSGFERLIDFFPGKEAAEKYDNIYRLTFAEDGFRSFIDDWDAVMQFMLKRLHDDVIATQHPELTALYDELMEGIEPTVGEPMELKYDLPVLSLSLIKRDTSIQFFNAVTTLGTPLFLTTQELIIESFFPANDITKRFFSTP